MKLESRREAVALAYGEDDSAPRVIARGYGELAEQIAAEARRHGVFVHESSELTALLMQLDLDEQIPAALYEAIAEVLLWIEEIRQQDPPC